MPPAAALGDLTLPYPHPATDSVASTRSTILWGSKKPGSPRLCGMGRCSVSRRGRYSLLTILVIIDRRFYLSWIDRKFILTAGAPILATHGSVVLENLYLSIIHAFGASIVSRFALEDIHDCAACGVP